MNKKRKMRFICQEICQNKIQSVHVESLDVCISHWEVNTFGMYTCLCFTYMLKIIHGCRTKVVEECLLISVKRILKELS